MVSRNARWTRTFGALVLIAAPLLMLQAAGDHSPALFLGAWFGAAVILSAIGIYLEVI